MVALYTAECLMEVEVVLFMQCSFPAYLTVSWSSSIKDKQPPVMDRMRKPYQGLLVSNFNMMSTLELQWWSEWARLTVFNLHIHELYLKIIQSADINKGCLWNFSSRFCDWGPCCSTDYLIIFWMVIQFFLLMRTLPGIALGENFFFFICLNKDLFEK